MQILDIIVPITIVWESGVKADYDYSPIKLEQHIRNIIEQTCKPIVKKTNMEIQQFVKKCEHFAVQFNEEPKDFWDDIMNNKGARANKKSQLAKELRLANKYVKSIKQKIQLLK